MMDLDSLSSLVDAAPEPPAVERVARRGKQRRRRRHAVATTTALALVVAAVGTAAAIVSSKGAPKVAAVPPIEQVRVTLLDGSRMKISGPPSLGLSKLTPSFNGALRPVSGDPQWGTLGHGFSVGHAPPADLGAVIARYPTHDGHELIVHTTSYGVDAVVQYGDWWLDASWSGTPPAQWTAFASQLNGKETADGFLVIEPTDPSWKLGPADAPDVQLGGSAYGSGAAFGFFGPSLYPAGCPKPADATTRTSQGWPVLIENGAWWCDANEKVRVHVTESPEQDAAIDGLRVTHQPL